MLVLLAAVVTGAWADTTVTWTASDMSRIYIDFLDGEAYNNTIKGITVTSSGGGSAGDGWERTDFNLSGGSTTITFTSSVGNIKSIAITAENIEMSSIPSGWTTDYSTLSWSGEASTTVPLPLSGRTEISGISEIVFTIESTVNVTGITLDKTEASMIVGGETLTLTPTVAPGNATDKTVTWTTSDASVATVADGVVTAVAVGTATITATSNDDATKTATCTVTVSPAGYSVALKEGTDDAANWQGKAGEGEYQELPLEGVAAGTAVTVKYFGTKKVESVKAVKKAAPAPARTLAEATAEDLGKVVGADGNIYDDAAAATAASTTAVAVIAYVGIETYDATFKNGLAIALADEGSMNWSTVKSTCEGKTAITGAKWCLPSQDQWKQMFKANGGNEGSYTGLNNALAAAGGDSSKLQEYEGYWSSSSVDGDYVWIVIIDDGGRPLWDYGGKGGDNNKVRACLAF